MIDFTLKTSSDYVGALSRDAPRGKIWALVDYVTGGIAQTFSGVAEELARIHARFLAVLEEADPSTAVEMLDAWERVLGLPEPEDPSPPTVAADRQALASAKLIARGGSQPGLLSDVIENAAYTGVALELPTLLRADEGRSDDRAYDGDYVWIVYVWRATTPAAGWARLEALLNRIKPAHCLFVTIDGLHADEVTTPT